MAHPKHKIVLLIAVFALCCAGVVLSAVSFGTEYWVTQEANFLVKEGPGSLNYTIILRIGLFTFHYTETIIDNPTTLKCK